MAPMVLKPNSFSMMAKQSVSIELTVSLKSGASVSLKLIIATVKLLIETVSAVNFSFMASPRIFDMINCASFCFSFSVAL